MVNTARNFLIMLNNPANLRLGEDVLTKKNIFALLIHLPKTSSKHLQDIFKTSSRYLQDVLKKSLQDIFKTSSRRLEDVFKTSSRHLQDVLQKCLQDVFKTYYQIKLFLLARFQDVFETYSKRFWQILQRRSSKEGFS